jgi:hypothetical protein
VAETGEGATEGVTTGATTAGVEAAGVTAAGVRTEAAAAGVDSKDVGASLAACP